jgi:NADP-dependent 3-hydroxy acid dehydrogenase YdfG
LKLLIATKGFSTIDVLINNAGNAHGLDPFKQEIEDWDAMIDINVKGLLYVSKAIIPQMIERKSGHIINIGSTAAKEVIQTEMCTLNTL